MSEINADLGAQRESVGNPARAAGPNDVLGVGLEVEGASEEGKAIGQFHDCLVFLHSNVDP